MTRIEDRFRALQDRKEKALVTYIMAGDPDLEVTKELVFALEEGGADIIELGVPFSDPLADGPVIQRASERALASKTSLSGVLGMVKEVRKETQIPIVLMTYYNIIFSYGEKAFAEDASKSGVDGIIIPDLPPDEGEELIALSRRHKLDTIFLLAPTSNEKRVRLVSRRSTGFIYYVSLTGVTGVRSSLSRTIAPMTGKIRAATSKPVVVGFGISNADQAAEVASYADGVVVGSAIVKIIEDSVDKSSITGPVKEFVSSLKRGMTKPVTN